MLRPDGWVRGRITLESPDCVVMPALDGRTRMVPAGTPAVGMRKCTVAPATGALFASVTSTAGGVATASPSAASWSSPARMAILAGNAHPMSLKQQLDPPTPEWTIDA